VIEIQQQYDHLASNIETHLGPMQARDFRETIESLRDVARLAKHEILVKPDDGLLALVRALDALPSWLTEEDLWKQTSPSCWAPSHSSF